RRRADRWLYLLAILALGAACRPAPGLTAPSALPDDARAESRSTTVQPPSDAGQPPALLARPAEAPSRPGPDQAQVLAPADAAPAAEVSALAADGADQIEPGPPAGGAPDPCDQPPPPLPGPGVAAPDRWRAFREPLSPATLWN